MAIVDKIYPAKRCSHCNKHIVVLKIVSFVAFDLNKTDTLPKKGEEIDIRHSTEKHVCLNKPR